MQHQSYNRQLKGVHLPSAFNQKAYDEDIGDNASHFHEALDHWRQLNLSPGFIQFANQVDPMSMSMPLLLHNWRDIIGLWVTAMEGSDDEGLKALLECVLCSHFPRKMLTVTLVYCRRWLMTYEQRSHPCTTTSLGDS